MNPIAPLVDPLRSAPCEDATEAIRAAWSDYLPQHAAILSARILSLPDEVWERDPMLLVALARCQRAAPSSNPFAALAYLDAAAVLVAADPDAESEAIVQIGVCRARALCGLGRVSDARRELAVARAALAGLSLHHRLGAESLVLFGEGACLVQVGDLDGAGMRLRHGLALEHDPGDFAAVEALGWLAFVEYFTAESFAPELTVARARERAGGSVTVEFAPALIVEAMMAIDEGRTDRASVALELLDSVAVGTEYAVFARHLACLLEAEESGPLAQLDRLHAIQLALHEWQSPVTIRALHDIERAGALIAIDALGAARDAANDLAHRSVLHGRHAVCPAQERARLALHVGEYDSVLELTATCRTLGDRHAPRSLAHIDVLRAAAHVGLGDTLTAASAMDRALLQAARTGWRRHFLGLPTGRLESMLSSADARPQPAAARAVIADLRSRLGSPTGSDPAPALSARERVVLGCLLAGESRQQMASRLSVSPNTIKAQVRSIYRKLGASNRHEAIDRAAKYGLTT